jgi:hypothetical protein
MSDRSKNGIFSEIKDAVEENIDARLELLQIQASDKAARLVGAMTYGIAAGSLFVFGLLFLSFVAGFYFSYITGSRTQGFGIVVGIYALLIFLLIIFRKRFVAFISNIIIAIIFENIDEEE